MEASVGPPRKKKANDELALFLHDVELDEKISDQLAKLRKGTPAARKQALRDLSETSECVALVNAILPMLREPDLNESERSRLVKLLCRTLQRQPPLGTASPLCVVAEPLLSAVKQLLDTKDHTIHSEEAYPLLLNVARTIGMKVFITSLRSTFDTDNDNTRQSNATCIAAAAQTFGVSITLPLVRVLVNSPKNNEKILGLLIVQRLPRHLGKATLPFLRDLVSCCSDSLKESNLSNTANSALSALADAVAPYGIEAFELLMDSLWTGARRRRGKPRISFLRTLAALVPLTEPDSASELADPIVDMALQLFTKDESSNIGSEEQRLALSFARKCVSYITSDQLKKFMSPFFANFWIPEVAVDRRIASLAVWTAVELPVPRSELVGYLVESNILTSEVPELQRMGLELLARLEVEPMTLDHRTEERLMDGLLLALPDTSNTEETVDTNGLLDLDSKMSASVAKATATANGNEGGNDNGISNISPQTYMLTVSVRAVNNVIESLDDDRFENYARPFVSNLMERDANPSPLVRQNAVRILNSISSHLPQSELLLILKRLYEELGEEYPEVLSDVINALRGVLESLDINFATLDPPLSQILPRITPILRNRNERVQESCIKLLRTILGIAGEDISAREWMHICYELLELQKSQRQQVRYEATAAFAAISAVVGPVDIVATLLSHLRSPDRQFRVTTAAAIASIAVETGPFTVLPVLINEYSSGETLIQHGVLKTLSFLFEFIGPRKGLPYFDSIATLLDDALVDKNQVHRQTAASVVHFMAQGSVGCGKESLFIHFLNELMPSIFETSPHVIDRVLEAINSIRQLIGTPAFTNYVWAGLFHPSRKVRNVYWKLWNLMYQTNADAIVPSYPVEVPDLNDNSKDIRDVWF